MEAGVACGNARASSNAGSPTLAPSSSRPSPPATAVKRPTNHATEDPRRRITHLRTKSSHPPRRGRPTSLPRHPSGTDEGPAAHRRSARGFWGFGGGSERREKRIGRREGTRGEEDEWDTALSKVNTRLAMAAMLLLSGVLLLGQQAANAEEEAKVKPMSTKADCEVSGTCDMKLGAAATADPTRPGAKANESTSVAADWRLVQANACHGHHELAPSSSLISMEKVINPTARLAMAVLCLLLVASSPAVRQAEATEWLTYPKAMISCKVLGNCEKNAGPDATRPGKPANTYTRGCSAITRCRG
nr:unnamed protein product [Digitaria exilis]